MTLRILLFGPQAMLAKRQVIELELSDQPHTAEEIINQIATEHPALGASIGTSRLAINHEFADHDQIVPLDAEVALIGMVSGG